MVYQWMARTNDAVGSKTANTTGNSVGGAATEKDAILRRLGELHRLLNSRKGSLNATHKKNTDVNDKAYDLNTGIGRLAAEYVAFEATMAKCHKRARGMRCITRSVLGSG